MSGFVYAIEADNGLVKIGFTSSLESRLSYLRANNAQELKPIGAIPADQFHEKRIHGLLSAERVKGEWFRRGHLTDHFLSLLPDWPDRPRRRRRARQTNISPNWIRDMLLNATEAFAKRHNLSLSKIGDEALKDSKFLAEVRNGRNFTIKSYQAVIDWMDEYERAAKVAAE